MRTYRTTVGRGVATLAMLASALAPRPLQAQRQFEGVITYEIYTRRQPQTAVVTAKGLRLRADGWDEGGRGRESGTVLVNAKGEVIMAMPEHKAYLRVGSGDARLDNPPHAWTFTKTGRSETVLGNSCDYYTIHNTKAPDTDHDLCITTSMGSVNIIPGRTLAGPDAHAQFPNGFLVLKAVDKNGQLVGVVTKIDRHPVSDDLFEVGSDWREMNTGMRSVRP